MYFTVASRLAARQRAEDHEWLGAGRHGVGQGGIGGLVGEILGTRKEAHERAPPLGPVIADRAAQHREAGLERVERGALRDGLGHLELHLSRDVRECAQMRRQHHAYHRSVWTSTESTDGRSRTSAVQWSPASADA